VEGPSPQLATVVAQWRGGSLALGECLHTFRELHGLHELTGASMEEALNQLVKGWISEKIFAERAREKGMDRDPKYLERIRPYREDWLRRLLVRENVDEKVVVTNRDLKRKYDEQREKYRSPASYSYYRIFFSNEVHGEEGAEELARECWGLLDKGANFHDLVDTYSDTEASKKYTLYGPFQAGENTVDIEDVIMNTPVRRHSSVVRMPNGFMIFYPERKSEPVDRPFDKVQGQIAKDLFAELREQRYSEYLEQLSIEYRVDPKTERIEDPEGNPDEVVLSIEPGAGRFTLADFEATLGPNQQLGMEERRAAFENFARLALLTHHARTIGFEESDYFRTRFRPVQMRFLSDFFLESTVDPNVDPTPEDVKKFYEENPDVFRRPARMEIWHIARLIRYPLNASELDRVNARKKTLSELFRLREIIATEGLSFITFAGRFTEYEDGGYMGMVPLVAMPAEWVSRVGLLEEGEISAPIVVQDTVELVMRGKYEEPGVMKLESALELAEEQTRADLIAQARATEIERVLTEVGAQIDMAPIVDMTLRLTQASETPPKYWLDPYW
jgi:parvulin-like peptidyl-prolyl isomerase